MIMKNFGRFILYSGFVLMIAVPMLLVVFLMIVGTPKDHFAPSYQSVIQDKYDKHLQTNEPKIILTGGSNLAFGLDEKRLEEATGYKVVNLGLHAGFGYLFNAELAKGNINSGDIVLLAYEYGWAGPRAMDNLGVDLVMSGIDHRLDMYRHIPARKCKELLGYLNTYGMKKLQPVTASGAYSSAAFDTDGSMIYDRPCTTDGLLNYENNKSFYGIVDVAATIPEDNISYVKEFRKYVEKQGASIYFVAAPVLKDAVICTDEDFRTYERQIVDRIGIPYLSDSLAYMFSMEYMYDTIYHCNNVGEQHRTDLLIQDLVAVGIGT